MNRAQIGTIDALRRANKMYPMLAKDIKGLNVRVKKGEYLFSDLMLLQRGAYLDGCSDGFKDFGVMLEQDPILSTYLDLIVQRIEEKEKLNAHNVKAMQTKKISMAKVLKVSKTANSSETAAAKRQAKSQSTLPTKRRLQGS